MMGDLNARVGNNPTNTGVTVEKQGEQIKNTHGSILIELCMINDLVILNTFYQYKDCHKYKDKRIPEMKDHSQIATKEYRKIAKLCDKVNNEKSKKAQSA